LLGGLLERSRLQKEIVVTALNEGYQITENALHLLERSTRPLDTLAKIIASLRRDDPDTIVIDVGHVEALGELRAVKSKVEVRPVEEVLEIPPALSHTANYKVKQSCTEEVRIDGSIEEFKRYFINRYHKIRRIIEKRGETFVPVSELTSLQSGHEASVIVMVLGRRETARAIIFDCDDPSGLLTITLSKKNEDLLSRAESVLLDQVVGMKVRKMGETYLLQDIYQPDTPNRRNNGQRHFPELYVCLISDLHVGSRRFRRELVEKFLDWLNRGRDAVVKRLKYIIIDGDLVDGIGVYPGQEKELEVGDVEEQFREASKLLKDIPAHMEVIYCPGNHEPVRKALPQPPLQAKYRQIISNARPIFFASNPFSAEIEGRSFLIYHGQGLDEIVQSLPNVSYSTLPSDITNVLTAVMRARHLAPRYGESTQLLPLEDDPLVIEEPPELLQTGHVHVSCIVNYRNTLLVNSGAWQDQTNYQRSLGLEPAVGTAVLVELSRFQARLETFT